VDVDRPITLRRRPVARDAGRRTKRRSRNRAVAGRHAEQIDGLAQYATPLEGTHSASRARTTIGDTASVATQAGESVPCHFRATLSEQYRVTASNRASHKPALTWDYTKTGPLCVRLT